MKKVVSILVFGIMSLQAGWSPPAQISPGPSSTNIDGTPLVIDSNSVALIGWLNGPLGGSEVLSSATLTPLSNTWTLPQTIYTNMTTGTFVSFPSMSFDYLSNQTAGFSVIDLNTATIELNASRRPANTIPWQVPFTQNESGFPGSSAATNDNLGNMAALFASSPTNSQPWKIILLQILAGNNFWTPQVVLAPSDPSIKPSVSLKAVQGNAILAWKTTPLQLNTQRLHFSDQSFTDLTTVPLLPSISDVLGMEITLDPHGNAILIYGAQVGTSSVILYASTLLSGGSWSYPPVQISDSANKVISGTLACDANGTATILWGEEVSPTQQFLRVATLPLGGTPTFVTNLTSDAPNQTLDSPSHVVMDSYGNAAAVWQLTSGGDSNIQVAAKPIGQDWTGFTPLTTTGVFPLIALSEQGTAVTSWIDSVSTISYGSRNLTLFALAPPSNFVGKLNSTGNTLKMSWNPSPAPNISYYQIFKGNTLIATIPGGGPFTYSQPTSRFDTRNYTLRAVASNTNMSRRIPIKIIKKCYQY